MVARANLKSSGCLCINVGVCAWNARQPPDLVAKFAVLFLTKEKSVLCLHSGQVSFSGGITIMIRAIEALINLVFLLRALPLVLVQEVATYTGC